MEDRRVVFSPREGVGRSTGGVTEVVFFFQGFALVWRDGRGGIVVASSSL